MAGSPLTAEELASRTETDPRYIRKWLSAQAASGYVQFDPVAQQFSLSEEQAFALAMEGSPAFIPGAFQVAVAQFKAIPKMIDAFRSGKGLGWHEHDAALFHGTERFFRPGYAANLVSNWIPALEGVEEKLKAGARVADVGCGYGASTVLMAEAYPKSHFFGFDYHEPSIRHAREAAKRAGISERIQFEVVDAKRYRGGDYDLVAVFDCLHDMGDPVGASSHVLESLRPDGTWMIVEPFAHDCLEENLNPVGRVFYSASTFICTPASRAQELDVSWRSGGRSTHRRSGAQRRLQTFPSRCRNTVQPDLRGAAVRSIHIEDIMARKHIDCRNYPSEMNCTLAMSADSESELLDAAVQHAVAVHGHKDTPEFRRQLKSLLKEGSPERDS